jgi:beta-glucosidase
MSYGQINYTDIRLSSTTLAKGQSIKATVRVTNHAGMATKETVLMMISKYWRSIAPPIQELNGFTKIELEVGKHQDVSFEIFPEMLTFVGRDGKDRIENGVYQVTLGDQSANFTVTGYQDWYKLPAKDMA